MPAKKSTTGTKSIKSTTEKKTMKTEKVASTLQIDIFDIKGGKTTMTLPAAVFGVKINKTLMAQAVRVYMANQRMGTAKAKTRGEVQGSTRKIYQQKGTGRARHGGIRAPLFVGGGVAHGPRPHDFGLAMPKKMKKQALFSALTSKKQDGNIMVVKGLDGIEAKTKAMMTVMKHMGMEGKKTSVMVVLPTNGETTQGVLRASRNIAGVTLISVSQLTTYEVLKSHTVLFMQEAIENLKGLTKEK